MIDTQYSTDLSPQELLDTVARFPLQVRTRAARTTGGTRQVSTLHPTDAEISEDTYYEILDVLDDLGAERLRGERVARILVPYGGVLRPEPLSFRVVHRV